MKFEASWFDIFFKKLFIESKIEVNHKKSLKACS